MDKRQEIEFDLAVGEIVENLIGCAVCALFDRPKFVHIIEIEIRDAPAFDLSGGAKVLKRIHCFHKPRLSFSPMQKIKIDRVDSESLETALARFW